MKKDFIKTRLTPHFTLWEMTRSGTAISRGIKNEPGKKEVERLTELCDNVLEPLRRRFGVIRITSGFRCPELNVAVGGAKTSQHMYGEAADIHINSVAEGQRMCDFIARNTPFDQLLLERVRDDGSGWIHVSHKSDRGPNRRQYISDYKVEKTQTGIVYAKHRPRS